MTVRLLGRCILAALTACSLGLVATPSAFAATQCTGPTSTPINGNVQVPAGDTCTLNGANVSGNVSVAPGGSLVDHESTIGGSVTANHPNDVFIFFNPDNHVGGGVSVTGGTGGIICGPGYVGSNVSWQDGTPDSVLLIGGGTVTSPLYSLTCSPPPGSVTRLGSVTVSDDGADSAFVITGNVVTGSVRALDNTGPGQITNNTIGGNLSCSNNTPPVTSSGNAVGGANTC